MKLIELLDEKGYVVVHNDVPLSGVLLSQVVAVTDYEQMRAFLSRLIGNKNIGQTFSTRVAKTKNGIYLISIIDPGVHHMKWPDVVWAYGPTRRSAEMAAYKLADSVGQDKLQLKSYEVHLIDPDNFDVDKL